VFRIVFELFIVKEELFASRKDELGAAVYTFEDSIGEFHGQLASQEISPKSAIGSIKSCRSRFPVHFHVSQQGPGPH
jgi:hypothetical protein